MSNSDSSSDSEPESNEDKWIDMFTTEADVLEKTIRKKLNKFGVIGKRICIALDKAEEDLEEAREDVKAFEEYGHPEDLYHAKEELQTELQEAQAEVVELEAKLEDRNALIDELTKEIEELQERQPETTATGRPKRKCKSEYSQ